MEKKLYFYILRPSGTRAVRDEVLEFISAVSRELAEEEISASAKWCNYEFKYGGELGYEELVEDLNLAPFQTSAALRYAVAEHGDLLTKAGKNIVLTFAKKIEKEFIS